MKQTNISKRQKQWRTNYPNMYPPLYHVSFDLRLFDKKEDKSSEKN